MDSHPPLEEPTQTSTNVALPPPQQEVGPKGCVGIANIGNTCYMNSVLQVLRSSLELTAFYLEDKHTDYIKEKDQNSPSVRLTKAYIDLLRYLWSGNKPQYLRPDGFFQEMCGAVEGTVYDQFKRRIAHDAHEFMNFMMDTLHTAVSEEVHISITRPPPLTETDKLIHQALEYWKQNFQKSYSPLVDVLFGLYQREMHCEACGHKSYSWEVFNCLKLGFPQVVNAEHPATLEALLKEEFKDEVIEGYACDRCAPVRTIAKRRTFLWKLPRTLFVVLKRFTMTGQKIQGPFQMDITTPVSFTPYFNEHTPEPSRSKQYSLFGTVDHHGVLGGGHYTAQALNLMDQKWYGYDDDSVYSLEAPTLGSSTYIVCLRSAN